MWHYSLPIFKVWMVDTMWQLVGLKLDDVIIGLTHVGIPPPRHVKLFFRRTRIRDEAFSFAEKLQLNWPNFDVLTSENVAKILFSVFAKRKFKS